MVDAFKNLQRGFVPQKSLRIVRFQPQEAGSLGLEELTPSVKRAYQVRLCGGINLPFVTTDSYEQRSLLLRKLKELKMFIPVVVENIRETVEDMTLRVKGLIWNFLRYTQKSLRHHKHVRPSRSTENFRQRQQAFC